MNNPSTCPHFSLCSGCTRPDLNPHLISDGFTHTRYKAKLAVRPGPEIGLFRKNSHDVLSIPHCLVHHPSINRAVDILRQEIIRHNLSLYRESPPSGNLRYIQLFVERSSGKVQLSLMLATPEETFCQSLLKYDLWHSIWLNFHQTPSNRILGDSWQLIHGEPFLWQTLRNTPVAFHPAAFSQTHLSLFEKMLEKIESYLLPTDKVLELYAGVGAIGLTLRRKVKELTLVENNPYAHLSFLQSKTDIPYLLMDAKGAPLDGYDLIIVDPPRKGLDPLLLKKLCELPTGRLIYISCGQESYQRDRAALLASNWKLKEETGYLLFAGTDHVETLVLFEKEN